MATEIGRIVDQVRRSFSGDAWHGPSVMEALSGVDEAAASARPVAGAHSIAEIVAHLDATQRVVLERIEGRGRLEYEEWPAVAERMSAREWSDMLARLGEGAGALERAIAGFAGGLGEPLMEGGSSAFSNFLGHAQHNAYHAGQIRLLARMARVV